MRRFLVLSATLAMAFALPAQGSARDLIRSDPYDARIVAAYNCNRIVAAGDFSDSTLARCRAEYDTTVQFERSVQGITPAQRSTIAIARGLSMMTMSGAYTRLDGVLSARACEAIRLMDQSLAGYDPAASSDLEDLYTLIANTRDVAMPKCRIGGHWR
ncbi:hypothetical protein I5L01_14875 [Erythrobacter sp. YJ-T3-07]|uniref:hypothetical protein n=1 Tax=Erythrobacter sp. YJ-T3-07 TaxID=2793063 RepID=UPI0018D37969|nr:hypothetical protein [Erythrobacter sp. YJ-T3-07]MBH1945507.1 hypothetical protein [Erythrobacter sp. YJ-T3-07]